MGRFITEDPIKDGSNYYAYCNNNPITFIDPTGLSDAPAGLQSKGSRGGVSGGFRGSGYGDGSGAPAGLQSKGSRGQGPGGFRGSGYGDNDNGGRSNVPAGLQNKNSLVEGIKGFFESIADSVSDFNARIVQAKLDRFIDRFGDITGGLDINDVISEYNIRTDENITANDLRILFSNNSMDQFKAEKMLKNNINLHVTLRDILNRNVPQSYREAVKLAEKGEWKKMPWFLSIFHDYANHWKFVSADGHREAVYDKDNGKLITRFTTLTKGEYARGTNNGGDWHGDQIMGTFNFGPPSGITGHIMKDMNPYKHWGCS